jgi:hypothetical protein
MADEQEAGAAAAAEPQAKKKRAAKAKRPAAKKKAGARSSRARVSDEARIKILKTENPYRESTIGFKLYEAMRKAKTVGDFRAAGKKIYKNAMAYLMDAKKKKAISLA